jgi:hypothetical protein
MGPVVPLTVASAAAAAFPPADTGDTTRAIDGADRPDAAPVTPWGAAAEAGAIIGERSQAAGAAIGERSQAAGAATGAFFGRLGRRIANSF